MAPSPHSFKFAPCHNLKTGQITTILWQESDEPHLASLIRDLRRAEPMRNRVLQFLGGSTLPTPEETANGLVGLVQADNKYHKMVLGVEPGVASSHILYFPGTYLSVGCPTWSVRKQLEPTVLASPDYAHFGEIGPTSLLSDYLPSVGSAVTIIPRSWKEALTNTFMSAPGKSFFCMQTFKGHASYQRDREFYAPSIDELERIYDERCRVAHTRGEQPDVYDIFRADKVRCCIERPFRSFHPDDKDEDIIIETEHFDIAVCTNAAAGFLNLLQNPDMHRTAWLPGYLTLPMYKSSDRAIYVPERLLIGEVKGLIEHSFGDISAAADAFQRRRDEGIAKLVRAGIMYSKRGDHRWYLVRPSDDIES